MSTKFSIRPAPRKRPWICKRSPPCLIPAPYPASLLCSFMLQRRIPGGHDPPHTGSLILPWRAFLNHYQGSWLQAADGFTATFIYNRTTGQAQCTATWDLDTHIDFGNYPPTIIPLPPKLLYTAAAIAATTWEWRAALNITG